MERTCEYCLGLWEELFLRGIILPIPPQASESLGGLEGVVLPRVCCFRLDGLNLTRCYGSVAEYLQVAVPHVCEDISQLDL
ncbi:hypothetical protein A6R68_15358, partial [Neotoma lepida]